MSYGLSLIPSLIRDLFEKDYDRLNERIGSLIEENFRLRGSQHGYLYFGEFWTLLPIAQRKGVEKRILHPSLQPQGKEIYDERKLIQGEQQRLTQGLSMLLRDCHNEQDVRDALPDTATLLLPNLASLPRTRPDGWPYGGKALHQHTHELIVGIFDFYAANQILR